MTIPPAEPAPGRRLRVLVGAFGDPGHAFPAIALGKELRARGHDVTIQTWRKWQAHIETEGMRFARAPEYQVFPTLERPLRPYEAVVRAVRETRPLIRDVDPHVVVSDILTLAPALSAELEDRPWATLVPHLYPDTDSVLPPFGLGSRVPATGIGRRFWKAASRATATGLERGRTELNETRRRVGLPPLAHVHGGISRQLALVATFPQLEYPREWPPRVHITGPLIWEPPAEDVELPSGEGPLVVLAPSTSQDPKQRLLEVALAALERLPVRVLAIRPKTATAIRERERVRLVTWMPYSRTLPHADVVVCHGGHGTLAHALANGVPVVMVPAAGDMMETGTRVQWAGVGFSLPKPFLSPRTLRLLVQRVLEEPGPRQRAEELAAWTGTSDAAARAAVLTERLGCA